MEKRQLASTAHVGTLTAIEKAPSTVKSSHKGEVTS
jgi:hypothetical protein